VLHLGAERLSILVLAEALTRYSAQILSPAEQRTFWRHSVLVALLSSQIARFTGLVSPHQAYLAGLVHAIGLIPLALLGRNTALLEIPAPTGTDISPLQRERNTWGLDHCEAGRLLAEAWNLQPELAEVCAHHHDPAKARRAPELTGVVAAAVAASLLHDAAGGCLANLVEQASHGETRSFDELLEASLPALGSFDRARLRDLLEEDLLHNVTWMDCISGVSPNLMRQDADRPNRIP
jgi:HD-like signal output (HDOD) protein